MEMEGSNRWVLVRVVKGRERERERERGKEEKEEEEVEGKEEGKEKEEMWPKDLKEREKGDE